LRAGWTGNRVRSFCSGEQYDQDLGLYYLRARYYNPSTGRFLGRDPEDGKASDPSTLHKYLYAGGDPVNRIDSLGREAMLEVGSLDAIIGSTPVPVLVELAGGVYASAAAAAVQAYLYAMNTALDAGIALADYLAAGKYVATVTGLTKVFLCTDLSISLPQLIDKYVVDGLGQSIPDEALQSLREACLGLGLAR
jgi:RHS repeat-associated protein